MTDLPTTFNSVLAAMRADGASLPSFVEWEEMSRGDQAFLTNLITLVIATSEDNAVEACRAKLQAFVAKLDAAIDTMPEEADRA